MEENCEEGKVYDETGLGELLSFSVSALDDASLCVYAGFGLWPSMAFLVLTS